MFVAKSKNMTVPAYNLILIQIPDLLVAIYKRGNVKEKLPDIKPKEKSEFGPLSYVAGYVISKMYRKSNVSAKKDTPEQQELQSLLLSMKSLQDNEYIDSLSQGKLWNPCENLLAITAECEKVFRQHTVVLAWFLKFHFSKSGQIFCKSLRSSLHGMLFCLMLVWLKARHL